MDHFAVKDGHFWLKDKPLLIQAAEFHYYRTPPDQWAHRLGLMQQAGFNTLATYIPWLWHQPEPGITDVDGHTHPMRNLAGFLDLAADMGFHIIARPGPYIMAETINEGIPPWVFAQNPQASFIDQTGKIQNIASYLQPDFLRCVEEWYKAVFEVLTPRQITTGGRILLIQLDNEMAMIHWVRNIVDINPDTLTRFAGWLEQAYGDRLSDAYPAADLPAFLREQMQSPQPPHGALVIEDYRRFFRSYLREYMAWLWEQARAQGMDVPPVLNIHGFGNGGKTFAIGLSQLIEAMELDGMVSATDVYPIFIGEGNFHQLVLVNEMTKALQIPEQPLFSIEFQAGGNQDFGGAQSSLYDLHTRLCISCGMRAINHYLFFDGENDPVLSPNKRHDWGHPVRKDGTLRHHYARYPKLSRALAAYGEALVRAQPHTVTTVGFVLDDYMTEINNSLTRPATDILTHQRDVVLFDFLARGLALTHRHFDALELARADLNPQHTPTLWVMMDRQCEATVQEKLAEYVRQGGRLVLAGRMCTETFHHTPCTVLQDALGIRGLESDPPFTPALISAFSYRDVPVDFLERYDGDCDEIFATSAEGQTVGFVQRVGQGQVMVFGAALAANTLDDLDILHRMANRMGCRSLFTLSDWADVRLSEGAHGNFMFVNNYQDDPIETVISGAEGPMFGGYALSLPARRGAILPLEWDARPGLHVHWLTAEVTDIIEDGQRLVLRLDPPDYAASLSLTGYRVNEAPVVSREADGRVTLRGSDGVLELVAE